MGNIHDLLSKQSAKISAGLQRWVPSIRRKTRFLSLARNPVLLASVFLCAAIWILFYGPAWQVSHAPNAIAIEKDPVKRFELENEARRTLSQIILSAFGLFALYFTWRRVIAGDRTARIAEQGHITDRYTKAIEQLGKWEATEKNIEVRLGGIYALERIAKDSPRDHGAIMEVLTAYVRRNARLKSTSAQPTTADEKVVTDSQESRTPTADIEAIIAVLRRRITGGGIATKKL